MTINEIKQVLNTNSYDFLRTNEHLGKNIIFLSVGGSHAYGTNTENSDIDIRGCAVRDKHDILYSEDFEQITDTETDTTVYSIKKLLHLLTDCNPNTIELLGLKPEHYLYTSDIGKELLNNRKMFLSRKAIGSFGNYATGQFRRMDNKSARMANQAIQEEHILNSIKKASREFPNMYFNYPEDSIKLYIDDAVNETMEKEIFMDISLKHYPLRDYKELWNRMAEIVKSYSKIGKRNQSAINRDKLGKHMMHLIRLYIMCIDILEKGEIITYRDTEHDMLMEIRDGKYLDSNRQPTAEFFEMVETYKKRLEYAGNNTDLPDYPDYTRIKDFEASINEKVMYDKI